MNSNKKDQITTSQATIIMINSTVGAGILTLPRVTAEAAKTADVWISLIISGALISLLAILIVMLCQRYEGKTLFEFMPLITGKWIAIIITLMMATYFVVFSAFELRVMLEVTGVYLLEGTPDWVIIMLFMWIGLYLTTGGINAIARLYQIVFPITILIFVLCIFLSSSIFDVNNLRPVLGGGIMPVFKGIKPSLLSYIGYESLFVTMAFMKTPQKGKKIVLVSTVVSTMIYILTVVMVIGGLSINGVVTRTWPTLDLMRSFEKTGLIFERFESLLLVIWLMQIFATFTITHYLSSLSCAQIFNKSIRPFLIGMLSIIFLIAMIPKDVTEVFKMGDTIGIVSLCLFGSVTILFLLISTIRKKVGGAN